MQVEELVQEDSRVDRYPKLVKGESKVVWEWQGKKVYPMPFDNNKQGVGSPKCCLLIINMVLLLGQVSYPAMLTCYNLIVTISRIYF